MENEETQTAEPTTFSAGYPGSASVAAPLTISSSMLPSMQEGYFEQYGLPGLNQLKPMGVDQLIQLNMHLGVTLAELRLKEAQVMACRTQIKMVITAKKMQIGSIAL